MNPGATFERQAWSLLAEQAMTGQGLRLFARGITGFDGDAMKQMGQISDGRFAIALFAFEHGFTFAGSSPLELPL